MSDDDTPLWSIPVGDKPLTDGQMRPPQKDPNAKAARHAAMLVRRDAIKLEQQRKQQIEADRKAKKEEAVAATNAAVEASVDEDQTSTHIWIGPVMGNIRNETKAITGKSLPNTHYIRLDGLVNEIIGANVRAASVLKNAVVVPVEAKKACALRLTKSQAMKAKLSYAGKQEIVEDPDGSKWKELVALIGKSKLGNYTIDDVKLMAEMFKRIIALA